MNESHQIANGRDTIAKESRWHCGQLFCDENFMPPKKEKTDETNDEWNNNMIGRPFIQCSTPCQRQKNSDDWSNQDSWESWSQYCLIKNNLTPFCSCNNRFKKKMLLRALETTKLAIYYKNMRTYRGQGNRLVQFVQWCCPRACSSFSGRQTEGSGQRQKLEG